MAKDFSKVIDSSDVQEITLTYVVDADNDDKDSGGNVLLNGRVIAQNNAIYLDFNGCNDIEQEKLTAYDLRCLADKLKNWADVMDGLK